MGLQIYYVFISFYGWIVWSSKSKLGSDMGNLKISHIGRIPGFMASITFIILSGVFYWILVLYTDSDVPFWDALTTSGGVVATWMLTRKYIEHWLIWVFLDIVSIVLYIYKGLYPTTFLFVIYTIMALVGYRTWKNLLNDQRI